MEIRKIDHEALGEANTLVWETFLKYEAPDYEEKGINTFRECINSKEFIDKLEIYGAYKEKKLQGVIATRSEGNHIALFFVREDCQRQGIGRQLFEIALNKSTSKKMTVNSSPYAVDVYHKLGFKNIDNERITDGIRYIPMERICD